MLSSLALRALSKLTRAVFVIVVCAASAAVADPTNDPFTYHPDQTVSPDQTAPELASALPDVTDPVQKVMPVSYTHLTLPTNREV